MKAEHGAAEASSRLLKRTRSRCPICHVSCPAEVKRGDGKPARVFLERTCAVHGTESICIASDAQFYWLASGNPENSGCCGTGSTQSTAAADASKLGLSPRIPSLVTSAATDWSFRASPGQACCAGDGSVAGTLGQNARGRGDGPFEKLSTCLALIEIVNSCNLACPTCYADSPVGNGEKVDAVPLADLQRRIQGVIDRKCRIEILQLSGGEPTLHPHFFELVEWVQANPGIDYLLLNTNGVRIANDAAFTERLTMAARRRKFQLYLQFDGPQLESQLALRGADLRKTRLRAIERCQEINLPLTLAMTVSGDNLGYLWKTIEFGLGYSHIRGVCFQPMFTSGRTNGNGGVKSTALRLNTADILLAAVEQSDDKLRFEDFTPLPCGDPNCATIGYLLKADGCVRSISEFIDFTKVQGFLHNKVRYSLEDLMRCGCEAEPLGALLKQFEMNESNTFRILVKPFMDAWTWDDDRIDRCCTHVIRPDGRLDSFCRYYSGFGDLRQAP
jgi:uncharacterized radical SAM superfamily Fe-S cluster-containing enzyme